MEHTRLASHLCVPVRLLVRLCRLQRRHRGVQEPELHGAWPAGGAHAMHRHWQSVAPCIAACCYHDAWAAGLPPPSWCHPPLCRCRWCRCIHHLQMWDVGGQKKIRMLWHHYFRGSHALIFVVDSNDRERFDEGASTHASAHAGTAARAARRLLHTHSRTPRARSPTHPPTHSHARLVSASLQRARS